MRRSSFDGWTKGERTRTSVAMGLLLGLGGCAGAPWFLGRPRGPEPVVPAGDLNPGLAERHARRLDAVEAGHPWEEILALRALAAREALRPAERARLVALLSSRADVWRASGRPRAELAVREELRGLAPFAPGAEASLLTEARHRAALSWWELGEKERARALEEKLALPEPSRPSPIGPEVAERSCGARDAADASCARRDLVFPPGFFAGPGVSAPSASAEGRARPAADDARDEELLGHDTLTEAFLLGDLAFVQRIARRPEAAQLAEILRDEDDTSSFNWERIAWLALLRGHEDAAARAFGQSAFFSVARDEAWARAAIAWEAAGLFPRACGAWQRAANLHGHPWDPRWPRLLRCLARAPRVGDRTAWVTFLQNKVEPGQREAHARWLESGE